MTKKDLDKFTKDISRVAAQQSKKIKANTKEIGAIKKIVVSLTKTTTKSIEGLIEKPKTILDNNGNCFVVAILDKKTIVSQEDANIKMEMIRQKVNAIMKEYKVENLIAIIKK